jgi:hypothetical protein
MCFSSVFFKEFKLHETVGRVQFELFEKHMSANYAKLNEKAYDYLLIIFMKNITGIDEIC